MTTAPLDPAAPAALRGMLGVFVAAALLAEALTLAVPAALAGVVDGALRGDVAGPVTLFAALVAGRIAAESVAALTRARYEASAQEQVQAEIIDKVLHDGIGGRMMHGAGATATRRNDAQVTAAAPTFFTQTLARTVVSVVSFGVLFAYHWALAATAAAALALLVFGLVVLTPRLSSGFDQLVSANERSAEAFLDATAGRRTIAASGLVHAEIGRVGRYLSATAAADGAVRAAQGHATAVLLTATLIAQVAAVVVGLWLFSLGDISAGALVAATIYSRMFHDSVFANMNEGFLQLPFYRTVVRRHREYMAAPAVLEEPARPQRPPEAPIDVAMRDVAVSGPQGPIISASTMTVRSGTVVALVGLSGVGKSTLAQMVGRLLDPDSGEVTLSGCRVDQMERRDLAATVSYGFEIPLPLGDTLGDLVDAGRGLDDLELRRALDATYSSQFVDRLPDGLATEISAAPLSGGEWQRLGLARAVAQRGRVLVLDDPTSSLDIVTEHMIRGRLAALCVDAAVVVVAHRASMAAWADQVAWIVDGAIARVGRHAELWSDPEYRRAFGEASL